MKKLAIDIAHSVARERDGECLETVYVANHKDDVRYFVRFDYSEKDLLSVEYVTNKLSNNDVPLGGGYD